MEYTKKLFVAVSTLLLFLMSALSACSSDNNSIPEKPIDPQKVTLSLIPETEQLSFNLTHSTEGVIGEINVDFYIFSNVEVNNNVDVEILIESDILPKGSISLNSNTATIKKGERKSGNISLTVNNWSDIINIQEELLGTITVKMGKVTGEGIIPDINLVKDDIIIRFKKSSLTTEKSPYPIDNLIFGEQPEGSIYGLEKIGTWGFSYIEGSQNTEENSVNGSGAPGVVYTEGEEFWFSIDFKELLNLSGVYMLWGGTSDFPKLAEIYCSEDNNKWWSIGVTSADKFIYNIKFKETVKTRYIKIKVGEKTGESFTLNYFYPYVTD